MTRRLWGACASQQALLDAALGPARVSLRLTEATAEPIGWGVGFYENGEPLVRKTPLEERPDIDLLGVVSETRSDLLIGHVRAPTVGALRSDNTHPFRFRHWLFAHSGTIESYSELKGQLTDAMPPFLQRRVGDTDSECLFHLILSFLHDSRQLDNPRLEAATVAEAMAKAVVMIDELEGKGEGGESRSTFNLLLSNGGFLVALHRNPVGLSHMTYEAPGRESVKPRAVLVACENSAVGDSWAALPDQSTLTIERDLTVEVTEF